MASSCHSNSLVRLTLPCPAGGFDFAGGRPLFSARGLSSGLGRFVAVLVVLLATPFHHPLISVGSVVVGSDALASCVAEAAALASCVAGSAALASMGLLRVSRGEPVASLATANTRLARVVVLCAPKVTLLFRVVVLLRLLEFRLSLPNLYTTSFRSRLVFAPAWSHSPPLRR